MMHPNVIDAFYRFVALGSNEQASDLLAGSQRSATRQAGVWCGQRCRRAHDHGSATSDLG